LLLDLYTSQEPEHAYPVLHLNDDDLAMCSGDQVVSVVSYSASNIASTRRPSVSVLRAFENRTHPCIHTTTGIFFLSESDLVAFRRPGTNTLRANVKLDMSEQNCARDGLEKEAIF
jgi:hypothetical protein